MTEKTVKISLPTGINGKAIEREISTERISARSFYFR